MVGYYKVKAKKGLLVREGAALDTPEVTTLDNGLRITCEEEATVDGKVRLRLTSPVRGWASKKLRDVECKLGARLGERVTQRVQLLHRATARRRRRAWRGVPRQQASRCRQARGLSGSLGLRGEREKPGANGYRKKSWE